jgi:DNA mismatch repair protein MutS2
MDSHYEKSMRTLELPRVLEMLCEHAVCEDAKQAVLSLKPAGNIFEARSNMSETSAAVRMTALKGSPPFSMVRDVSLNLKRAEMGGSLGMGALLEIAALLTSIRRLKTYNEKEGGDTLLDNYFYYLLPNKQLEDRINSAVLSEEEMADSASGELAGLRRRIRAANSRVRETLQKIITSPAHSKHLQDAIITQRSGRYVVPVKSEHKNEVSGLVHDVSSSGATFFIEPMQVVTLNNEIRELMSAEQKEIERILAELSAEVAEVAESIIGGYGAMVKLDVIFAKAKLAQRLRASEPEFKDDYSVNLKKARHPLLNRDTAVPITVSLGIGFDTLVVTGPNTGGKTVTLKTIGLLSLMAACGMYIPAEDGSHVSIFNGIYADIGDEQSIEQSLSTFSSHMTNISAILGGITEGSMVLFDELGAGTDPVEGAALAISIILYARNAGARVAATTHYAELKEFALSTPGVENASCEFDVETLKPTYKLLIGVPGRSNAFAVSARLGIDGSIIDAAKGLVDGEKRRFEDILGRLDTERRRVEEEAEKAFQLRVETEQSLTKARKFRSDAEKEKDRARDRANKEAEKIISQARDEVAAVFAELETLRQRLRENEINEELNRAKGELRGRLNSAEARYLKSGLKAEKAKKPNRPIREGDTVRLLSMGTTAVVVAIPDKSGNITVQAGSMKITLKANTVELIEGEKREGHITLPKRESIGTRPVSASLDLRGLSTEEALLEVSEFIDNAIMSNLNQVTVIHGKGTGTLRSAVQQSLRANQGVKSFRLGKYGEGEDGVTVVEL